MTRTRTIFSMSTSKSRYPLTSSVYLSSFSLSENSWETNIGKLFWMRGSRGSESEAMKSSLPCVYIFTNLTWYMCLLRNSQVRLNLPSRLTLRSGPGQESCRRYRAFYDSWNNTHMTRRHPSSPWCLHQWTHS